MKRRAVKIVSARELEALPEPSYLIDRLIPASGIGVLYGQPKHGKTFVALDLALSVAAGVPWMGRRPRQGWVVYVAAEGFAGLKLRERAWRTAHGGEFVEHIRFVGGGVNLLDPQSEEELAKFFATLPKWPRLIVIDTMARAMAGGDENSARDVGMFIDALDRLRQDGAALVLHHTGHGGDRERGSSALRGAVDLSARLHRKDRRDPLLTLSCEALKDGIEWDSIALRLTPRAGSCVITPPPDRSEEDQDEESIGEAVLRVLRDADEPLSGNKVVELVARNRKQVLEALRAFESSGLAVKDHGGWVSGSETSEPPRNHPSGANGGGWFPEGGMPEGHPSGEPPPTPMVPDKEPAPEPPVNGQALFDPDVDPNEVRDPTEDPHGAYDPRGDFA